MDIFCVYKSKPSKDSGLLLDQKKKSLTLKTCSFIAAELVFFSKILKNK